MTFQCNHSEGSDHVCCSHISVPSVHQTLDEIDFERGIWSSALNGDSNDVDRHLSKGVHVDAKDSSGYTALHYASRSGHLKVCQILVSAGADTNAKTKSGGVTPLHRAAYKGHIDVIKLLIKHRADLKIVDFDGKTALHKAVEGNRRETVELLVKLHPESLSVEDKRQNIPQDYVQDGDSVMKSLLTNL